MEEKRILKAKYEQPAVIQLPDEVVIDHIRALLFKINVITGWEIPEDDLHAGVLIDQLKKHMLESYPTVNFAEFEYAFRVYGTSVKDWGKAMNLNLFDQVMTVYMQARREASKLEESLVTSKAPEQLPPPEISDDELIDGALKVYRLTSDFRLISGQVYQILVDRKLLDVEDIEKWVYLERAKSWVKTMVETDMEFRKDMEATRDLKAFLQNTCRRMVVADYFNKL